MVATRRPTLYAQLELELRDGRIRIPWNGTSPRALTRVHLGLIFQARAAKSVSDFVNPDQLDLFENSNGEPPHLWGGSPSLLPLLEDNHGKTIR